MNRGWVWPREGFRTQLIKVEMAGAATVFAAVAVTKHVTAIARRDGTSILDRVIAILRPELISLHL